MCSNMFLESDGFCTMCGKNHFAERDRSAKETRKWNAEAEKKAAIQRAIQATPEYRTAREVVDQVADLYGIQNFKVVFRNRRSSYHEKINGTHYIVFGYQQMDEDAEKGYREYKTLDWFVPQPRPKGTAAATWLALHEAAHMIQVERGQRLYGDQHGPDFRSIYKELRELFL